ncbi:MAG: hypothetical protein QXS02_04645 [Candidatus Thermoplasmatota archaeon]
MKNLQLLIGCLLSVLLLVSIPSVSAVKYRIAERSAYIHVAFNQFKGKIDTLGCPASRALLLWELICIGIFLAELMFLKSKPLAFAIAIVSTYYLFTSGVYVIAVTFTGYTGDTPFPLNWKDLSKDDKFAACFALIVWILLIALGWQNITSKLGR